ncbi:MAG: peptidase M20 [Isosphaeraceae bacterium]|jgi:glutamate carboxypeptidase|nr:MAG: peptidase M20 [Isosphaeraceae bacterium]
MIPPEPLPDTGLSPNELARRLLAQLEPRRDAWLDALLALVEHESPSRHKPALDSLADLLSARFAAAGAQVQRLPNPDGGDHLRATWTAPSHPDAKPILVLTHYDTVWPLGTLQTMPAQIRDGRATGPGIYDMKASLILAEAALSALQAASVPLARPVVLLATSDEEIGSPTSRSLIEAEARQAHCTLVLEAPLANRALKTARKGVACYRLDVYGQAAHSGVEPDKGASAILELARQILAIQSLARPDLGTTINIGLIAGGSAVNVVPAEAHAEINVRISTLAEFDRLDADLRRLQVVDPRTRIQLTGQLNRPPMERTPATVALFHRTRDLARLLGLELGEGATGGASDGNFASAVGCPTLDGLGCDGDGAHATHEHIQIDALAPRAALLGLLFALDPLPGL